MAVRLNKRAFEYAKGLISAGRFVYDDRDEWSEHQPSAAAENRFIEEHGYESYGAAPDTKAHYKFPYGDFDRAHRCGLLAAESRAGQLKYYDTELAVAHLHGMLDALHAAARVL